MAKVKRVTAARITTSASDHHLAFYGGLIRLHVLHHATEGPIYGMAMIEELARHGYKLSAGTLYPILETMEDKGYLVSVREREGRTVRRFYRATPLGRRVLAAAKQQVRELFGELFEAPASAAREPSIQRGPPPGNARLSRRARLR